MWTDLNITGYITITEVFGSSLLIGAKDGLNYMHFYIYDATNDKLINLNYSELNVAGIKGLASNTPTSGEFMVRIANSPDLRIYDLATRTSRSVVNLGETILDMAFDGSSQPFAFLTTPDGTLLKGYYV